MRNQRDASGASEIRIGRKEGDYTSLDFRQSESGGGR